MQQLKNLQINQHQLSQRCKAKCVVHLSTINSGSSISMNCYQHVNLIGWLRLTKTNLLMKSPLRQHKDVSRSGCGDHQGYFFPGFPKCRMNMPHLQGGLDRSKTGMNVWTFSEVCDGLLMTNNLFPSMSWLWFFTVEGTALPKILNSRPTWIFTVSFVKPCSVCNMMRLSKFTLVFSIQRSRDAVDVCSLKGASLVRSPFCQIANVYKLRGSFHRVRGEPSHPGRSPLWPDWCACLGSFLGVHRPVCLAQSGHRFTVSVRNER